MAKLWLTYAWKDNEDFDIDHVIHELETKGLEVHYDRAKLLAGQRLWQQIDKAMNDPDVGGWAMFVSEASLKSEPCQEEIGYALDRALRTKAGEFPLIGIFAAPLDRAVIPSALATRLHVNLQDPSWATQVLDGVTGRKTAAKSAPPTPFGHSWHEYNGGYVLEVWPRSGRWFPFAVAVSAVDADKLGMVKQGPRGGIVGGGVVQNVRTSDDAIKGKLVSIGHAIDSLNTGQIFFRAMPSEVHFGQPDGAAFIIKPQ